MKDISFNPAMLAAVREGRKTVTRRQLSKDLVFNDEPERYKYHGIGGEDYGQPNGALFEDLRPEITPWYQPVPCPFGEVGDTLRVEEDPSILLEIVELRAERVQDITEQDAIAEGIESVEVPTRDTVPAKRWKNYLGRAYCDGINLAYTTESFRTLYCSIYGPESWERNEWVWVVVFRPTTRDECDNCGYTSDRCNCM